MSTARARRMDSPAPIPPRVSAAQATGLLKIGMGRPVRPIDGVIGRLRQRDGASWVDRRVEEALRGALTEGLAAPLDLLSGRLREEDLETVKRWCKKTVARRPEESEESRGALLVYFLVLAVGAAHLEKRLTQRAGSEVGETLVDLSDALPAAWADVARRGAERLGA
ncbi:MAG: hypothetical protein AB7G17_13365 [Phycisphaerales bacterium]